MFSSSRYVAKRQENTPVLTTVCTPDHTAANNAFVNAVLGTGASRSPHQPTVRIGTVELLRVGGMEADRACSRDSDEHPTLRKPVPDDQSLSLLIEAQRGRSSGPIDRQVKDCPLAV